MRIAVVHSYYASANPSGESASVDDQVRELENAGHKVRLFSQSTDRREALPLYQARSAVNVAFGTGPDPTAEIERFRPDVVHVHNLFPNIGTRWLSRLRYPLVATVQNFRPMCAAATLYRDGDVCTLCPDGDPWAALRYKCYRDSYAATLPLAWRNRHGVARDAVIAHAQRVVCVSKRSVDAYVAAGADPDKFTVVPNFAKAAMSTQLPRTGSWLYAGRVTEEKGLHRLLTKWPAGEPLDVLGDGPDLSRCRQVAPSAVHFYGAVDREQVLEKLAHTRGLLFPSRWFEGLPVVLVEALSVGAPVVASIGSSAGDVVDRYCAGALLPRDYEEPDIRSALAKVSNIDWTAKHLELYESLFSPAAWIHQIRNVYNLAIADFADARGGEAQGSRR